MLAIDSVRHSKQRHWMLPTHKDRSARKRRVSCSPADLGPWLAQSSLRVGVGGFTTWAVTE